MWLEPHMAVNNWCNSGSHGNMSTSSKSRGYDGFVSYNALVTATKSKMTPKWRLLWRKIVKEKKKIFDCASTTQIRFTYDPHSYSQNFDHGLMVSVDPDDVSRSFSARFAVPPRSFEKDPNREVVCS